ncbi:hypothetical protein V2O64_12565 [Verrucomicrobiaceae bacterium 227]
MKEALLLLSLVASANAAVFLPITDIAVNMTSGNTGSNPLSNIIEGAGSGFDGSAPHVQTGGTWYTDAPGGFPSDYISANPGSEYIWLNLGSDVLLTEISYWGYSDDNANGMREFNLSFATGAEGGTATLGDESYGASITANPSFTALQASSPRQSFSFAPVTAQFVRIEATSTFFGQAGAGAGGDRLGIGEIAFENIPEPSTSLMAVLGAVCLLRRKRMS